MADDINTAINSGGYVIVPEKAVDGTGKDAIYVYMTYNSNGNQAWKIAGGLNGGILGLSEEQLATISGVALGISAGIVSLLVGHIGVLFVAILAVIIIAVALYNLSVWSESADACFGAGAVTITAIIRTVGAKSLKSFFERLFVSIFGGVVGERVVKLDNCI